MQVSEPVVVSDGDSSEAQIYVSVSCNKLIQHLLKYARRGKSGIC